MTLAVKALIAGHVTAALDEAAAALEAARDEALGDRREGAAPEPCPDAASSAYEHSLWVLRNQPRPT